MRWSSWGKTQLIATHNNNATRPAAVGLEKHFMLRDQLVSGHFLSGKIPNIMKNKKINLYSQGTTFPV